MGCNKSRMIQASDTGEHSILMEDKFTAVSCCFQCQQPTRDGNRGGGMEGKEEGKEKTKATYQFLIDCSVTLVWPLKDKSILIQRKENFCSTALYQLKLSSDITAGVSHQLSKSKITAAF